MMPGLSADETRARRASARARFHRHILTRAFDLAAARRKDRQMISYRVGNDIDLDAFIDLYRDSTLGERRPIEDRERMRQMLERANLVVTAWDGATLVGVARSLSDFSYATYLSDIAVRLAYQRHGIGRELIRVTQKEGGEATVFLFAAPKAVEYYPRVGFTAGSGWMLRAGEAVK
jgi:predicted N-acetyltransferase YhbS